MSIAYVDSSVIVGIAFQDPGWAAAERRLADFSDLRSSNLLEAEVRAAYSRVGIEFDVRVLSGIRWVLPDRPLTPELRTALSAGYLRGADLWHVATALYLAPIAGRYVLHYPRRVPGIHRKHTRLPRITSTTTTQPQVLHRRSDAKALPVSRTTHPAPASSSISMLSPV